MTDVKDRPSLGSVYARALEDSGQHNLSRAEHVAAVKKALDDHLRGCEQRLDAREAALDRQRLDLHLAQTRLNLRAPMAVQALQALLQRPGPLPPPEATAKYAVAYADALVDELVVIPDEVLSPDEIAERAAAVAPPKR